MKPIWALLRTNQLPWARSQCYGYSTPAVEEQNQLFDAEVEKQRSQVGRIEKIEVSYYGRPKNAVLSMNKGLSTPHDVARHVSEWLAKEGAVALVDKEEVWDMHRPLDHACNLSIMTFTDSQPQRLNRVFWRSCSFLLGAVIQEAFRSDIHVTLHSFPSPRVTSGSFVYDALLGGLNDEWTPSQDELRTLSAELVRLSHSSLPLQRLRVADHLAARIFSQNKYKLQQIPAIAQTTDDGKITLYRVGQHIDISKGPMIANTNFIGRASVTAAHKLECDISPGEGGTMLRFQGVALPRGLMLNHFAYKILEDRAKQLNVCEVDYTDRREQRSSLSER